MIIIFNEEIRNDDLKFINYNIKKYMIELTIEFEFERNKILCALT